MSGGGGGSGGGGSGGGGGKQTGDDFSADDLAGPTVQAQDEDGLSEEEVSMQDFFILPLPSSSYACAGLLLLWKMFFSSCPTASDLALLLHGCSFSSAAAEKVQNESLSDRVVPVLFLQN